MRLGVSLPTVLAGSLLLAGLGLVGGCAENRSSLYIEAVMYIDPLGSECIADPSGDSAFLPGGTVDLLIRSDYYAPLLVGNQLYPVGNGARLRTETNRIQVESADITIEPLSGSGGTSFRVPVSATVHPGDDDPGQVGVFVELIPRGAISDVGSYIVHITLNGRTLGGTPIQSGEWLYPVEVCEGCLRRCPEDADAEITYHPCARLNGVDYAVDCRLYPGQDSCRGCPGF